MKRLPAISLVFLLAVGIIGAGMMPLLMVKSALAQTSQSGIDRDSNLAIEVGKLRQEVADLKILTPHFNIFYVSGVATVSAAAIAFFAALYGGRISRKISEAEREQERDLTREKHTMDLVRDLGNTHSAVRFASATLLFDRIGRVENEPDGWRRKKLIHEQGRLLQALVSVAKERSTDANLSKLIGDELIRVVRAQLKEGQRPAAKSVAPLHTFRGEVLDLQRVRFPDVYWRRVDGRGVDFYGSDFANAGLREAFLSKAIFYGASLKGCVLRDADLSGANLQDADLSGADLRGTNLKGALLVGTNLTGAKTDAKTVWPDGFDPRPAL